MSLKQNVDSAIDAALGSRIVGCVILIKEDGRLVYSRAAGFADREAGRQVEENAIFRLASFTKPIVATTTLRMADLGLLSLDDPVTKYLPWFTPKAPDGSTPTITLRHLITHTSGLTYANGPEISRGSDDGPLITLEENLRRLSARTLAFAPGTAWRYGMSIDVLGGAVAAINRSTLGECIERYVTGPLGMVDTRFGVTDRARLAVPYGDATPAPVRMAQPHPMPTADGGVEIFSPSRILEPRAPQSGGSGMAGTAQDFMLLLEALRDGDLLRPATRDAAFANQIGSLPRDEAGQRFGFLGAVIADPKNSGWPSAGMLHWGGIWGNNWIVDPASRRSVVVCTNTSREGCNGSFREQIRDAIFS
jgi:CubicO group peptidase (beta-lactamase class C family)